MIKELNISEKASSIQTACKAISRKYENEFFKDLSVLGVTQPTVVTSFTDYLEEVVRFISKLEDKGYAYQSSDGSVYFDVHEYKKSYIYPKLLQTNENRQELLDEGEGKIQTETVKRHKEDFALWKRSKKGEPE